ncbi:uncharacterized protein G2W53_039601 [Senna tora]|uniref:Uncharacterized protein n=1 Tax=Senna tora TaxID=362788 RepID=A0A834W301_9FABA|nr:uncharacterized protein G2W53_039601 [Senna tora]
MCFGVNEEVPLCQGKEPLEEEKEERPRVHQRVRSSTYASINDLPFPQLVQKIFSAKHIFRSAGSEYVSGSAELAAARWTIRELKEALAAKNAVISEMLCTGFGHIGSFKAGTSGVKREPTSPSGPPPGFDPLVEKSKEEEDSEDDQFYFLFVNNVVLLRLKRILWPYRPWHCITTNFSYS